MTQTVGTDQSPGSRPDRLIGQTEALAFTLATIIVLARFTSVLPDTGAAETWAAMFLAIVIQALPFLLLGVVLAALVSAYASERVIRRILPQREALAVPVAGLAGIGLVGCECASVPLAGGAARKGVPASAALAFLLAAPAVNPVVITSTLVAFPGQPEMAGARFLASLLTAFTVGWVWIRIGGRIPFRDLGGDAHDHAGGLAGLAESVRRDLIASLGFLILGAMIAAAVNTFVPVSVLDRLGSNPVLGVLALAVFAFVVALCSQTDAFVAASLTAFSPTARLVFLVVGPAMDIKLALLEAGYFGRRFASRFVPLTLAAAIGSAVLVGAVLL